MKERPIAFYPEIARELESINAAIFYQQIRYWSDKGSREDGWIYKTSDEIERETTLSEDKQRICRRILVDEKKWLEAKKIMLKGSLVWHYRLLVDFSFLIHPTGKIPVATMENPSCTTMENPSSSITETTSETTPLFFVSADAETEGMANTDSALGVREKDSVPLALDYKEYPPYRNEATEEPDWEEVVPHLSDDERGFEDSDGVWKTKREIRIAKARDSWLIAQAKKKKMAPIKPEKPKTPKKVRQPFDFWAEMEKWRLGERKDFKILRLFYLEKEYEFENWQQWDAEKAKSIKAATALSGYSSQQIQDTIYVVKEHAEKNDYDWNLYTVAKKISEVANKK